MANRHLADHILAVLGNLTYRAPWLARRFMAGLYLRVYQSLGRWLAHA